MNIVLYAIGFIFIAFLLPAFLGWAVDYLTGNDWGDIIVFWLHGWGILIVIGCVVVIFIMGYEIVNGKLT